MAYRGTEQWTPAEFNLTDSGLFRVQRHVLDANKKFLNGDHLTDQEVENLLYFYRTLEGCLQAAGDDLMRDGTLQKIRRLEQMKHYRINN